MIKYTYFLFDKLYFYFINKTNFIIISETIPLIPFSTVPQEQKNNVVVNPPYPLTITIPPTERISLNYHQDPLQKLESCGQEETVTSETRVNHQDFVQSMPPLPPYTSLPGSLHHRALLRAASIYAYHDLASSSTLPMYFPQI